ncbi:MAG: type II toxin-antitoxin system HicA family toxin [Pseudaminobacter sp.]|nr:type II toxin-antitoxin system HicA family toxin [Pseudaminobacter sp.]
MENFAKPLKKLLMNAGWAMLRQGRGDHKVWHNFANGQRITIATFLKSRHLANDILEQAGLPKAF